MKKNKQFIAGFVTCVILLSAIFITGFAEGITAIINPFPILFNGVKADIEAYNINGSTFLRLGDVIKYFGGTANQNKVTKEIEINTYTEEVVSMSTATAIEYDLETGLPVGAEYVDYEECENAIRYNGKIYVTDAHLFLNYGIKYMPAIRTDVRTEVTYEKGNKRFVINTKDMAQAFFVGAVMYSNLDLFNEAIGE